MSIEERVLLIAAHPDDEVIGAGIRLTRWLPRQVTIVHITDGSPRDPRHAEAAGFADREAYAQERRRELLQALALAGIGQDRCRTLGLVDQEAYLHLPELVEKIARLMKEIHPHVIYTHPYEGGHPDHDSAAFAVASAASGVAVREFTSYHAGPRGFETGEFLGDGPAESIPLTEAERDLKREMFGCFRSQEPVLRAFRIAEEKFREAPAYDFTQPPHPGRLHYENLGWNILGENWRLRAREALQSLPPSVLVRSV